MKETPPMSRKQAQFFAGIIIICTVVAALILVIDYQIKGAIIEQANRLRKEIEGFGQKPTAAGSNRPAHNPDHHVSYPSDLVRSGDAGMETAGFVYSANGTGPADESPGSVARGSLGDSEIPGTGE